MQQFIGYYATPEQALMPVVKAKNPFCGPAVLSAVLGIDTDTAAKLIQATRTGRKAEKSVTGATSWELLKVFNKFGWEGNTDSARRRYKGWGKDCFPTFATWVREYGKYDTMYVISLAGHFILYYNGSYCDNASVNWRSAERYPGQRERVRSTLTLYKPQRELI